MPRKRACTAPSSTVSYLSDGTAENRSGELHRRGGWRRGGWRRGGWRRGGWRRGGWHGQEYAMRSRKASGAVMRSACMRSHTSCLVVRRNDSHGTGCSCCTPSPYHQASRQPPSECGESDRQWLNSGSEYSRARIGLTGRPADGRSCRPLRDRQGTSSQTRRHTCAPGGVAWRGVAWAWAWAWRRHKAHHGPELALPRHAHGASAALRPQWHARADSAHEGTGILDGEGGTASATGPAGNDANASMRLIKAPIVTRVSSARTHTCL